jgi:hypothetical protein
MKAWSYSRLKAFETCPLQFYHMKVLRTYEEPETEAIRYGNEFHKAAEDYIATDTPLPKQFLFAQDVLDALNQYTGDKLCELKMGLTADLEPCDFFADDIWFRAIADLTVVNNELSLARSVDYKTGKSARYADTGQLELMALSTFAYFPEIDEVKAALLFVIANAFISKKYHRDDVPELWEKWLAKHAVMEAAFENDVWNPRPSGLCKRHCDVLECHHNGRN